MELHFDGGRELAQRYPVQAADPTYGGPLDASTAARQRGVSVELDREFWNRVGNVPDPELPQGMSFAQPSTSSAHEALTMEERIGMSYRHQLATEINFGSDAGSLWWADIGASVMSLPFLATFQPEEATVGLPDALFPNTNAMRGRVVQEGGDAEPRSFGSSTTDSLSQSTGQGAYRLASLPDLVASSAQGEEMPHDSVVYILGGALGRDLRNPTPEQSVAIADPGAWGGILCGTCANECGRSGWKLRRDVPAREPVHRHGYCQCVRSLWCPEPGGSNAFHGVGDRSTGADCTGRGLPTRGASPNDVPRCHVQLPLRRLGWLNPQLGT